MTYPSQVSGPNAPDDVKGPGCRDCLFMRCPIRDPRHHKVVDVINQETQYFRSGLGVGNVPGNH